MTAKPEFNRWKGSGLALLAAVLFGVSAPLAKLILPHVAPMLLAGFLYLGSGAGLGIYWLLQKISIREGAKETALAKKDLPWLGAAIITGGMVGPALLMWGLSVTPAANASLLLNFEGVLTALLAWFVFKENFDARIALGMALIAGGGIFLSWVGHPQIGLPWGSLAIIGACLAWAVDNNLTRKVSASDPVQIALLKGLVAGGVNTALAVALGAKFPPLRFLLSAGVLGFFGYGLSLTLFVLALRHIGTARTGAYFSVAPFIGAVISVLFLGDAITISLIIAAALMIAGVWLHLTEQHSHPHKHERMEHDHLHVHDAHHQHAHSPDDPTGEPHSHPHRHEELVHTHAHYPDIHHRHKHA